MNSILCAVLASGHLLLAAPIGHCAFSPAPVHDGEGGFPPSFEGVDIPGGLVYPVELTFSPVGDMFVAEKRGRVYVYVNEVLQSTPVLNIQDEVYNAASRGLLGLALHPGFVPDGGSTAWLYAAFTESPTLGADPAYNADDKYGHGVLVRYPVDTVGGNIVADKAAVQYLLGERLADGSSPDAFASIHTAHASCALIFAPDGTLFIGHGDGAHIDYNDQGGFDDPAYDDFIHPVTGLRGQLPKEQDCGAFRAQDLRSLSGKVLRIDPETGAGLPSNPFFDGDPTSNPSRIWALGLRNPYRFALVPGTGSTDPAAGDPGTLIVGDVGSFRFEELNYVDAPGLNFGWPCREGDKPAGDFVELPPVNPNPFGYLDCTSPKVGIPTDPIVAWHHLDGAQTFPAGIFLGTDGQPTTSLVGACSIGGAVYPGGSYPPEYDGLLFFGDYASDKLMTLELDAAGNPVAVRDFNNAVDLLVDIAVHPISGDIYYLDMGTTWGDGHIVHLRYGENLSPAAVLTVDAATGTSPHTVQFDASASNDPEGQALAYTWNFDDGSPEQQTSVPTISHTYTASGIYNALLRVTDPSGLFDETSVLIAVDSVPPQVAITSPPTGSTVDPHATSLDLFGIGSDSGGGDLEFAWQVDLHHNVHVHPDVYGDITTGPSATSTTANLDPHGGGVEIVFYEVLLTATKLDGAKVTDRAWYFPSDTLLDPIGTAQLVSRLDELSPPMPQGAGNPDTEVVRDGVVPQPAAASGDYFSTEHGGDQGGDDWIGMVIPSRPEPYARFVSLTFTEGPADPSGGWFEDVDVEILSGGRWAAVDGLVTVPEYPAGAPGDDFETFTFHFTPQYGDGIRLRGTPGGTLGYITCSELRAGMITSAAYQLERRDLSDLGSIELLVDELVPPGSLGLGNPDVELLRNGTMPQVGSTSEWAQFSTFHNGDQAGEDWLGYAFDEPQTIESLLFQEGLHFPGGGWFEDLHVRTQLDPGGPWTPVTGLFSDPGAPTPGGGLSYETFSIAFDPVVARKVRIGGTPGGTDAFVTAAELRAFGPWFDETVCGWTSYGSPSELWLTMDLRANTPPIPGYPILMEVSDADLPETAVGLMMISTASAYIPLSFGLLLVDPTSPAVAPLVFDAAGESDWLVTLPDIPAFAGISLFMQAGRYAPSVWGGVRYSTGLQMRACQ
ncbi:PQQ-dependent sugar dehydrogenase [Engelhardtia mirabilis]|uniref:Microbial collagenase n=1 Tax=Engelhardtia mirabilis TaxID=2528011 RepID=A0A518BSA4_9BACT|nr:Microbial collagenase precursor [Planctomycetes bacterium Pla133]QDV04177.1 Microbial collagenase precursor [Planctomycetes bacterium Pla86]